MIYPSSGNPPTTGPSPVIVPHPHSYGSHVRTESQQPIDFSHVNMTEYISQPDTFDDEEIDKYLTTGGVPSSSVSQGLSTLQTPEDATLVTSASASAASSWTYSSHYSANRGRYLMGCYPPTPSASGLSTPQSHDPSDANKRYHELQLTHQRSLQMNASPPHQSSPYDPYGRPYPPPTGAHPHLPYPPYVGTGSPHPSTSYGPYLHNPYTWC
ncbi:unnamed protein product [Cyprideis torosa]|uniref:Uncharacterized protein n=1 Tax=Cyprideis torosa TaxID=163714 RepID=A0A7R8WQX8_9CRUS|nr:unnamed protein product [Cyprideis torosa]CAG0908365.1 unnamed protein product [Cyprideis torosa]